MLVLISLVLFVLAIYLFIRFIVKRDHGRKEPIGGLYIAMGFGVLALFAAGILNSIFVPDEVLQSIAKSKEVEPIATSTLFSAAMTVGVIEESAKAIPLALFLYKKRYIDELTDGIIYFGIVGLTFGIIENISYMASFGGGVGITRILFMPYLHAGFTILFGLALVQKKVLNRSWVLVVFGYLLAVSLHGLYDFFAFRGGALSALMVLTITITLNIMVFVLFRQAQIGDEKRGQSSIGINKFCRHCGKANQGRMLFCQHCGKLS